MRTSFEQHFRGVIAALEKRKKIDTAVSELIDAHAAVYEAIRDCAPDRAQRASVKLMSRIETEISYVAKSRAA